MVKKTGRGLGSREKIEQQSFILVVPATPLPVNKKAGGVYLGGRRPCSVGQAETR